MRGLLKTLHGVKQALRKRLGLGNELHAYATANLPTEEEVSIGPFVRTEFEQPCSECGEEGRYFHRYTDATGRSNIHRLRCHSCHTDIYGETNEIPIPVLGPEEVEQVVAYEAIDPRDIPWPSEQDQEDSA